MKWCLHFFPQALCSFTICGLGKKQDITCGQIKPREVKNAAKIQQNVFFNTASLQILHIEPCFFFWVDFNISAFHFTEHPLKQATPPQWYMHENTKEIGLLFPLLTGIYSYFCIYLLKLIYLLIASLHSDHLSHLHYVFYKCIPPSLALCFVMTINYSITSLLFGPYLPYDCSTHNPDQLLNTYFFIVVWW